jgi:hypothetical protein
MAVVTKNRTYGKSACLWVITQKPLMIWGKNDQHIKIYLSCNFERRFLKKFTTYDGRQVMAIAHHYAYTVQIWALSGLK